MKMNKLAGLASVVVLAGMTMAGGAAHAAPLSTGLLSIIPNGNTGGVQATPETALNGASGFPCSDITTGTCTTNPVKTYGYTNITNAATLNVSTAGWFTFFFRGSGDSLDTQVFSINGHTFTSIGPGGTGVGSTPANSTFSMFLNVGTVPFSFTSVQAPPNGPVTCTATDGTVSAAPGCSYLIALANSSSSPGATGPQTTAWLGFSDGFSTDDNDAQDMVVEVQAPEPATIAVLGVGLVGLLKARGRRKAR